MTASGGSQGQGWGRIPPTGGGSPPASFSSSPVSPPPPPLSQGMPPAPQRPVGGASAADSPIWTRPHQPNRTSDPYQDPRVRRILPFVFVGGLALLIIGEVTGWIRLVIVGTLGLTVAVVIVLLPVALRERRGDDFGVYPSRLA